MDGRQRLALRRARTTDVERRDWVSRVKQLSIVRLLEVLQPIGIVLALTAFTIDFAARGESRVVAAWSIINDRAAGNSGKVQALEYLNAPRWFGRFGPARASLEGIDLGASPDERPIFLTGVDLSGANLRGARFDRAALDSVVLRSANLKNASFVGVEAAEVDFTGTDLLDVDLTRAVFLDSKFSGTIRPRGTLFALVGGELVGARLIVDEEYEPVAWLFGTAVSNAELHGHVKGVGWIRNLGEMPKRELYGRELQIFVCPDGFASTRASIRGSDLEHEYEPPDDLIGNEGMRLAFGRVLSDLGAAGCEEQDVSGYDP